MVDEINELQASQQQKRMFFALCNQLGWDADAAKEKVKLKYGLESFANISKDQLSDIIDKMDRRAGGATKKAIVAFLDMTDDLPYFLDNASNREMPMHEFIAEQMLKYFYIKEK